MPTGQLPDGREVDTASEEWRQECLRRWQQSVAAVSRHVATLRGMTGPGARQQRADYIARLEASDGEAMAQRVKAEFLADWEAEQQRRRQLQAKADPSA